MTESQTGMLILPDFAILEPGHPPRDRWGVRVVDDHIGAVGPNDELVQRYPADEVWQAADQVLAPGFVNAHAYPHGPLAHGFPVSSPPDSAWAYLSEFWWPLVEDRLDQEMIRAAAACACLQLLRSGVTAVHACLGAPRSLPGGLAAQADVVGSRGIRAVLGLQASRRTGPRHGQLGLQENARFVQATQQAGGLLTGLSSVHVDADTPAGFIQQAHSLAQAHGTCLHVHVTGCRPSCSAVLLRTLDSLGVLGPRTLLSVQNSPGADEIELLAARGARVLHSPWSECESGRGVMPLPQMLDAGVSVGLGSEGSVADFFETMRGVSLLHRGMARNPQAMPAAQVWYLATEGGAQALGLDRVGRLAPGWQADLQLIDAIFSTPATLHNLYGQLLMHRNAGHVQSVLVAGQVRVCEGVVLNVDQPAVRARLHAAAGRLWRHGSA